MSAHVGRARAYRALPWFRQRLHMAGRQREDKMFQTQASISPQLGEALSLSSEGGGCGCVGGWGWYGVGGGMDGEDG